MSSTPPRARARLHARFFDRLTVAAEAVLFGSAHEGHWQTLAAFVDRDGVDHVAGTLTVHGGPMGPSRVWWRYTLLLSTSLSASEALSVTRALVALEEAGGGPGFDMDRHALQVSCTMRWLDAHLRRVLAGTASRLEQQCIERVLREARVAKAWLAAQR